MPSQQPGSRARVIRGHLVGSATVGAGIIGGNMPVGGRNRRSQVPETNSEQGSPTPVVGVVGAGLIGGSLLRRSVELGRAAVAFDTHALTVAELGDAGIETAESIEELVAQVDLLVLAVSPRRVAETWQHARAAARTRTRDGRLVVIDVASVKRPVVDALADDDSAWTDERAVFVLSHPMAGRVTSGWASSRAELFEGAAWIVSPHTGVTGGELASILDVVAMVGARACFLDVEEHDRFAAHVSHLPHLISFAYDRLLAAENPTGSWRRFGAGSLADLLRVADADPQLWAEILEGNDEKLGKARDGLVDTMREPAAHRAGRSATTPIDPAATVLEVPAAAMLGAEDVARLLATGVDGLEVTRHERDGATVLLRCGPREVRGR